MHLHQPCIVWIVLWINVVSFGQLISWTLALSLAFICPCCVVVTPPSASFSCSEFVQFNYCLGLACCSLDLVLYATCLLCILCRPVNLKIATETTLELSP